MAHICCDENLKNIENFEVFRKLSARNNPNL